MPPGSPTPDGHLIRVDQRARLNVALLERLVSRFDVQQAIDALKAATTYPNPRRQSIEGMLRGATGKKARSLAIQLRQMPDKIWTWDEDDGEISVPRGAVGKIVRVLEECCGIGGPGTTEQLSAGDAAIGWYDREIVHRPDPANPEGRLRWYQEAAIEAILREKHGILRAPTGCLAGDTIVTINRARKGWKLPLRHVVSMFNGGAASGKKWDLSIPTFVRAPMQDGTVRLARVLGATESGKRDVYRVRLGKYKRGPAGRDSKAQVVAPSVVATSCHRFLTPIGWRRLDELDVGDLVMVDGGMGGSQKAKPWYKLCVCRKHPFVGRRGVRPDKGGWTVPEHRLVAEARENGMSFEQFMAAVEEGRPGLRFLDPTVYVVHHKDGNPRNNRPENLEVLTHQEHREEHRSDYVRNLTSRLTTAVVEEIEYVGVQETYDLEVERAEAFIANGVAVHNSGKTSTAIGLAARLRVPTLVVVWSAGLMSQWRKRLAAELGLRDTEIGLIGDGFRSVRPITIGMQQSLVKRSDLHERFGLVLCDEVQRFAARTFVEVVDRFSAEYRVGVSADETRRDKMEPVIYDVFGPVRHEVSQQTLVEEGAVIDVKCRVVPTDYEAPWYVEAVAAKRMPDVKKLDDEQAVSVPRTEIGLEIARAMVERGEQVLVWTKRVEHARTMATELGKLTKTALLIGGPDNREVFEEGIDGLRSGEIRAAVGTLQAVGTGTDIPVLGRGVLMVSIGKNRQLFGQLKGRLCRPGKEEAVIYVLWDRHVYGRPFLERQAQWNRSCEVLRDDGTWQDVLEYLKTYKEKTDA